MKLTEEMKQFLTEMTKVIGDIPDSAHVKEFGQIHYSALKATLTTLEVPLGKGYIRISYDHRQEASNDK